MEYDPVVDQVVADMRSVRKLLEGGASWLFTGVTTGELVHLIAAERRWRERHPPRITTWEGENIEELSAERLREIVRAWAQGYRSRSGLTYQGSTPGPLDRD